jgi:ArsR family transcriptional regulator, arsenate/arsenite/antimonite-responsive transcriptional repressor
MVDKGVANAGTECDIGSELGHESCYGACVVKETTIDMSTPFPITPAGPAAAQCCAPSAGLDSSLDAERIASVAKALAEPLRVRALDVLRRSDGQVCQCELIALFGISQSLLSHHMRKLRGRRRGDRRAET